MASSRYLLLFALAVAFPMHADASAPHELSDPMRARANSASSVTTSIAPAPGTATTPAFTHRVLTHRYADGAHARVHVLTLDLCHAGVTLRATSPDEGPATVRSWARSVGAAVAINGDFFDAPGPLPLGPARGDGHDWPRRAAYHYDAVIAMRADAPPAIFDHVPDARWTDLVSTQEIIVVDGVPRLSPDVVHSRNRHPRSALGFLRDGRTLLFVLVEGRTARSAGATTRELGELLRDLGAWRAVRLDGGGSSTLFVAGRGVVSEPSDGRERVVANHIGVMLDASPGARVPEWCSVR